MTTIFGCRRCHDAGWMCEEHPNSPAPHGACTAPQMPCPECQTDKKPRTPKGWESYLKKETIH
jgi:hypothetical protein